MPERSQRVVLVRHTLDPEALTALGARLCYAGGDVDRLLKTIEEKDQRAFVERVMAMGHESVLEHAVFAKYAKKITSGAWYDDYFSKLIGQKVSATMTVLGTDGPNPGGDQPPVRTTVTVVLTGVNGVGAVDRTFDTTSDKTVAEALQEGLGEGYTLTVSGYG